MTEKYPRAVEQALGQICDPFLDQNIVALGMVYRVQSRPAGQLSVALLLPAPDWPPAGQIIDATRQALLALPDVTGVSVEILPEPAWTPYRMAASLKAPLGLSEAEPVLLPAMQPSRGERLRRLARRLLRGQLIA